MRLSGTLTEDTQLCGSPVLPPRRALQKAPSGAKGKGTHPALPAFPAVALTDGSHPLLLTRGRAWWGKDGVLHGEGRWKSSRSGGVGATRTPR